MTQEQHTEPTRQITLRYNKHRADLLEGYAFATRRKMSEVLRAALDEYFDNHEKRIKRHQV